MEKRFENVNEYRKALKLAKFDATAKLAKLKAKEKALGLVRVRMDRIRKEYNTALAENLAALTLVSMVKAEWLESL